MNDPESGLYYNRRGEQVGTSEAIALMGATAASRVPGWLSMASRSPSRPCTWSLITSTRTARR
jgi:hypothetical protein